MTRRPLTDLVFLRRAPVAVPTLAVLVCAVGAGVAGTEIVRLEQHFAARLAAGASLNAFAGVLARGSSPITAATGWVAATLFLLAVLRLRREPMEPPPSLRAVEVQTPAQLRRGLRREYTTVRAALVVVLLVAAVDVSRSITLVQATRGSASPLARSITATIIEAAGLVVATAVLAWWARAFAARLQRLAAL